MFDKPTLPKPLASRIRAAQSRLESQIVTHVHQEREIPLLRAYIASYDADPAVWTAQHYPGFKVDDYPPRTNIARSRESLERKLARRPEEIAALEAAQAELARVEAQVLAEVSAMRPGKNRVPWPAPVRGIDQAMADLEKWHQEYRERFEREQREAAEQAAIDAPIEARRLKRESWQETAAVLIRDIECGPEYILTSGFGMREAKKVWQSIRENGSERGIDLINAFIRSPETDRSYAAGAARARTKIAMARARNQDLWDLCRAEGLYSPDDLPWLRRFEAGQMTDEEADEWIRKEGGL